MKILLIALAVFGLAFAVTALLDLPWVARHWVRQTLVCLLVFWVLASGFFLLRTMLKGEKTEG